jgi:NTE family protein
VLSGGGALGAYEVGGFKALSQGDSRVSGYRPLEFGAYSGTSVGAYNATFMASRRAFGGRRAIEELEAVWRRRIANTATSCGNGVYRIRGAPFQFLDPSCLLHPIQNAVELAHDAVPLSEALVAQTARFVTSDQSIQVRLLESIDVAAFVSVSPLDALVTDTIDVAALGSAAGRVAVVASSWKTGTPKVFVNEDLAERFGRQPILASMALPGLFPPVSIEDVPYVDGAVTMNTPLKPAIDEGADVLHVVFVDPLIESVPFPEVPSTVDSIYRLYLILVADKVNVDMGTAATINALLLGGDPTELWQAIAVVAARLDELPPHLRAIHRMARGVPYRLVEIHKYRPRGSSGSAAGLLDFQATAVDRNIERGFEDARRHDCATEGCILIEPHLWDPAARPATGGTAWPMD